MFSTDRRRARQEAAAAAARAADRSRLEEALAPYEHAVIDLRAARPTPPQQRVRVARRPRPLVYTTTLD